MESWSRYLEAEASLLQLRRTQRGAPTLGDAADHALLSELATLPPGAMAIARESGARLGSDIYAGRYHEEALDSGLTLLAEGLQSSGMGLLRLEGAFHRTARVHYKPAAALAPADPAVRGAFLEGLLSGYLSHAYNCDARANHLADDLVEVVLGEGRDVNRRPKERA